MADKKRFSLSLYMDDPIQREAWEVLQECPGGQRTALICRALCRMRDESRMLDALREMLRDMPRAEPQKQASAAPAPNSDAVGPEVLDFLRCLQNSDGSNSLF